MRLKYQPDAGLADPCTNHTGPARQVLRHGSPPIPECCMLESASSTLDGARRNRFRSSGNSCPVSKVSEVNI